MAGDEEKGFLWFKSCGLHGVYRRQSFFGITVPVFCVLGALASLTILFFWWKLALVCLAIFAVTGVSGYYYADRILFNQLFCPNCGYNPTRRKSDGEKRKDHHKLMAQIQRLKECPNCGATSRIVESGADE